MAVVKEWKCGKCGFFESSTPICIHCGTTEVARVFITPPGFKSDKTKFTDENMQTLLKQSGMTDFSNNLSTKHEKDFSDVWKPLPTQGSGTDKAINFSGELAKVVGGGVSMSQIENATEHKIPVADITSHPDDKIKTPVPGVVA